MTVGSSTTATPVPYMRLILKRAPMPKSQSRDQAREDAMRAIAPELGLSLDGDGDRLEHIVSLVESEIVPAIFHHSEEKLKQVEAERDGLNGADRGSLMPDRTQTLLVELTHAEIQALLAPERKIDESEAWGRLWDRAEGKLRTALSQPKHQGDEDYLEGVIREEIVGGLRHMAEKPDEFGCRYELVFYAHDYDLHALKPRFERLANEIEKPQPPTLLLSDEERERLGSIATGLEDHAAAGGDYASEILKDATFLRTLASQEHRGEEGLSAVLTDEAVRAGAKRQHEGEFEDHFDDLRWDQLPPERQQIAVDRFRECLKASVEMARVSPGGGDEELTMIALALKNQGIEGVTPERGVELLIERLCNQPPAGEIERLRERLTGQAAIHALYCHAPMITTDDDAGPNDSEEAELRKALAAVAAAVSPPSDSQGDQERCGGSGEVAYQDADETRSFRPCRGCPDCNPAPSQVEGDECERCKGSGVELRQGCGEWISDPCPDCNGTGKRQPEGGEGEDWPEVWMRLVEPGKTVHCDPACAAQPDVRRYLPAASQDSSALNDIRAAVDAKEEERCDALGRASKAEAERDRVRKNNAINNERAERYENALEEATALAEKAANLGIARTLQRDEAWNALEELAQELEQRTAQPEAELKGNVLTEVGEWGAKAEVKANREAASLVREKAAKLKGEPDGDRG